MTFAVVEVFCLAATATAWYWLWRKVVASPFAAWIAGFFCGFAPGLVTQATGHTNMISQPLVPFIVWRSLQLAHSTRRGRDGAIVGLLIVGQFFVAPEVLFHTAIGMAVFVGLYAWFEPSVRPHWRAMAEGLTVAAAVALALLVYPMAIPFGGPYSYRAISIASWAGNDLTKIVTPSADTLAGDRTKALRYAWNIAEQNVNYGWLVVLAVVVVVVVLWHDRMVRAVGLAAAFIVWCSMGEVITVRRRETGIPTPWRRVAARATVRQPAGQPARARRRADDRLRARRGHRPGSAAAAHRAPRRQRGGRWPWSSGWWWRWSPSCPRPSPF